LKSFYPQNLLKKLGGEREIGKMAEEKSGQPQKFTWNNVPGEEKSPNPMTA
jgi:hypothetical protein